MDPRDPRLGRKAAARSLPGAHRRPDPPRPRPLPRHRSTTEYVLTRDRVRRIADNEPEIDFERIDETPSTRLADFTGTFSNDEIEADLTITLRDGKLHYAMPRQETPDPLEPMFRDAFRDGQLVLRFRRDSRGRVTGITKHWDRVWELVYVRKQALLVAGYW